VQTERRSGVTRITEWEHDGVVYYVHVGCDPRISGRVTILALGPAATYRSVVIGPDGADQAIRVVLAAPDVETRSGTAECLLAMSSLLIH